jgi:hypothetical protein
VPGTYTATLRVNGSVLTRSIEARPDPRASWTQSQYIERRDFLRQLYAELSQIDSALNDLDAIRSGLDKKIHTLRSGRSPDPKIQQTEERLRRAQAISAEISSNPRNPEDDQWRPDKLRERLLILIDVYGDLSQGPPLSAHRREAAEIKPIYDAAIEQYRDFIRDMSRMEAGQ